MKKSRRRGADEIASTPTDTETTSAFHGSVHDNTLIVRRRIELVELELTQTEEAIVALETASINQKRKLVHLHSKLAGLLLVMKTRSLPV
jgi:hypothetical protein